MLFQPWILWKNKTKRIIDRKPSDVIVAEVVVVDSNAAVEFVTVTDSAAAAVAVVVVTVIDSAAVEVVVDVTDVVNVH